MTTIQKVTAKPVLAIDKDDTLLEYVMSFDAWYQNTFEKQNEGLLELRQQGALHGSLFELFASTPEFGDLCPLEGSQEAVTNLSKKFEVVVITATDSRRYRKVKDNISRYYPEIKQVFLATNKWEQMKLCKATTLIDDLPHNLERVKKPAQAICFARPWNTDYKGSFRGTWTEIVNYLLSH